VIKRVRARLPAEIREHIPAECHDLFRLQQIAVASTGGQSMTIALYAVWNASSAGTAVLALYGTQ